MAKKHEDGIYQPWLDALIEGRGARGVGISRRWSGAHLA